jgi:hypothetical protein
MALMAEPALYRWAIYLIRDRGEFIGSVAATTEKSAIAAAIENFKITDPEWQKQLVARRSGEIDCRQK